MSISVISEDVSVQGDVVGRDNLSIAGTVDGSVDVEGRLSIDASGLVTGTVDVQEAWIAGTVKGDVRATALIHVTETGRVGGEIVAPRIIVDPGAVIRHNEYADQVMETETVDSPIVDVISQPPQRVSTLNRTADRTSSATGQQTNRRRVVVKKRTRK